MATLTVTLFLIPNEKYQEQPPDPTWPALQNVELCLIGEQAQALHADAAALYAKAADMEKGAKTPKDEAGAEGLETRAAAKEAKARAAEVSLPTGEEGNASGDVSEGSYKLQVRDGPFAGWNIWPAEIAMGDEPKEQIVKLFPADNQWLLPLRLWRYDDDGNRFPLASANVTIGKAEPLSSGPGGYVYGAVPQGEVTATFETREQPGAGFFRPQADKVRFYVADTPIVTVADVFYAAATEVTQSAAAQISIMPTVRTRSADGRRMEPLIGATATIRDSTPGSAKSGALTKQLKSGELIVFDNLLPAPYQVTVTAPASFRGWPIEETAKDLGTCYARPGGAPPVPAEFYFAEITVNGRVQTSDDRLVDQELQLEIYGDAGVIRTLSVKGGTFSVPLDCGAPAKVGLGQTGELQVAGLPLDPQVTEQPLRLPPQMNIVVLQYKYGIEGQAVDEAGDPASGAVIDVYDDQQQEPVGSATAGPDGKFIVGTKASGNYFVAPRTVGGAAVKRQLVPVWSIGNVGQVVVPSGPNTRAVRERRSDADGDDLGPERGSGAREALTDLAAYPVLTEEISTTGVPAPSPGGAGAGGAGAGYGQAVDQAIRDVLGWRPGGDVTGFQAALTGAFQLREVEGHTEWAWQQRGYAVQADMGALTGAQASIYARAKSALDQILPLLAGLVTLNPALCPEQEREAIRTVVTAELRELVAELALNGGPRIQRVDELFGLLLGDRIGSTNLDPDRVQGQLGLLRQRFGLTVEWVETVDDERVLTNFRIVVEQVLTLQASWSTDRTLLSGVDSRTSLGTILIWLSRALEAVCESVSDLSFALDSVYIDAAQRQVIELRLGHDEPPLLLSDLMAWILQASGEEGPRAIQDAGKDGVFAFAPVLRRLHGLVHDTIQATGDRALPPGLRTPRVARAFAVLYDQLGQATKFAGLVHPAEEPQVVDASVIDPGSKKRIPLGKVPRTDKRVQVEVHGSNIRSGASAVLVADREELPDLPARSIRVQPPNTLFAFFPNPLLVPGGATATWSVLVTNEDGTESGEFPL
jgi:hypothetical protein